MACTLRLSQKDRCTRSSVGSSLLTASTSAWIAWSVTLVTCHDRFVSNIIGHNG
jgi:hypothetical protein